jgi:uncharacterized membrane protein YhhN
VNYAFIPLGTLVVSLALLVRAELREHKRGIRLFKPVASASFIAIGILALVLQAADGFYAAVVLIGLFLSAAGDMFLIRADRRRLFAAGLVSFLLAHLAYSVAFATISTFTWIDLPVALVLIVVIILLYRQFEPNLGSMKVPVLVYMLVISFMVHRATAATIGGDAAGLAAWLATGGAVAFYLSDVMLAWNRYARPFRFNRLSLLLYYGGQAAIAFSAFFVG